MALTISERKRIESIEEKLLQLANLVKGGGSKNQLNRLLVLAQKNTEDLKTTVEEMESKMADLLDLVRKLQ